MSSQSCGRKSSGDSEIDVLTCTMLYKTLTRIRHGEMTPVASSVDQSDQIVLEMDTSVLPYTVTFVGLPSVHKLK